MSEVSSTAANDVSRETVSRETLLAMLPLPSARPKRRHGGGNFETWWTANRLEALREHIIAGKTDAEIASLMATPDHPLTDTTIRGRRHRLGWVDARKAEKGAA